MWCKNMRRVRMVRPYPYHHRPRILHVLGFFIPDLMAKSIEEQIAGRCIHFTGIGNDKCKKGIAYDTFGKVKFQVIPCLKGGTAHCEFAQYPTPDEVRAEVERDAQAVGKVLKVYAAAVKHFTTTKEQSAAFKCPHGDHNARYTRAASNGHYWIACKTCQISFNE